MTRPILIAAAVAATALLASACRSNSSAPPASAAAPDTWATVDGRNITKEQVEKEFRRVRQPGEMLTDEQAMLAKLAILDDLIVEQALMSKANALKIEVTESELDTAFAEERKKISEESFQNELTACRFRRYRPISD